MNEHEQSEKRDALHQKQQRAHARASKIAQHLDRAGTAFFETLTWQKVEMPYALRLFAATATTIVASPLFVAAVGYYLTGTILYGLMDQYATHLDHKATKAQTTQRPATHHKETSIAGTAFDKLPSLTLSSAVLAREHASDTASVGNPQTTAQPVKPTPHSSASI